MCVLLTLDRLGIPTLAILTRQIPVGVRGVGDLHVLRVVQQPLARPQRRSDPSGLYFTPNHLWLDGEESGLCHIGIDAFAAEVVEKLDGVTFVTSNGSRRPTVVLAVNGAEWPLTFPNPLMIQRVNTYAQHNPERVTADPYGAGWLFEGFEIPERTRAGLISGDRAAAWQQEERRRLSRYVHEHHLPDGDGGDVAPGVARLLPKAEAVALFQYFFGRTSWAAED